MNTNSRFLPSELYVTGYGDFGTTAGQRRKRDRDKRRKERALDAYKKCVEKKGKNNSACKKDLAKALKYEEKETAHSTTLEGKGKTTSVTPAAARASGIKTKAGPGLFPNKDKQFAAAKTALAIGAKAAGSQLLDAAIPGEEEEYVSEEVVAAPSSGGSLLAPVAVGTIALVTLVGSVIYFRRPKKPGLQ